MTIGKILRIMIYDMVNIVSIIEGTLVDVSKVAVMVMHAIPQDQ